MRPIVLLAAGAFALPGTGHAQLARVTPELMARHISALAHDSMRGRGTPSREIEVAADYAESVFRAAGLAPAGEGGSYRQRFPVPGKTVGVPPTGPNVLARLAGSDPVIGSEYVAVIAHMDHVGMGRPVDGDSTFNGADDNASGTAGVLALAAALSGEPRTRRSILFILVSGEEVNLLGSRHFVANPTVPIANIVALVNLDMISRNRADSVYLNGWGKSTISDLVRRLAGEHRELGLDVGPDPEDRPRTPADSDHWPFQRRGIPYVFFYTGSHPDYHRLSDHPERSDADKAARVTRLAFLTLLELANATDRPRWDPEARRLNVVEGP